MLSDIIISGENMEKINYSWNYSIAYLKTRFFWQDMMKVILIPVAFLFLIMDTMFLYEGEGLFFSVRTIIHLISSGDRGLLYAGILIGICLFFTAILVPVILGTKYECTYIIDEKGIHQIPVERQFKKGIKTGMALFFAGLLTKNLSATGSGLITASSQSRQIMWKNVKKVKYYDSINAVSFYNPVWLRRLVLYVPEKKYHEIKNTITEIIGGGNENKRIAGK